jgi:hypothetical protein
MGYGPAQTVLEAHQTEGGVGTGDKNENNVCPPENLHTIFTFSWYHPIIIDKGDTHENNTEN